MNQKTMNRSPRKKINIVDVVIGVIFLLALATMIYLLIDVVFSDEKPSEDGAGVAVEYRVKIENVDVERFGIALDEAGGAIECSFLQIGDLLYTEDGGDLLGKLSAIQYEVSTASTGYTDSEGNLIYAECPGRINLILTVRSELSDNTLTVGGVPIRVGKELTFHTPAYHATAEILSIETEVE